MELKRRLLAGSVDQNLDRFLGRLLDDWADRGLIRASARLCEHEGSLFNARSQLLSFAASVFDLLETHWPEELPNADSG
jgi:hypothetical protein